MASMGDPVHVVVLVATLTLLWVIPAVLTGRVAARHGRRPIVYVIAAFIVGWPLAMIAALVVPRRRGQMTVWR
jgi:MFS family permease